MHMFDEIVFADRAEGWLDAALAEKRKIMGFGHRVYKNGDSRVPTMKAALDTLLAEYDRPDLGELYTALFTPLFVASRVTGWTAHIREQAAANALIRPLSEYVGVDERHL
jgi:citrate synthase